MDIIESLIYFLKSILNFGLLLFDQLLLSLSKHYIVMGKKKEDISKILLLCFCFQLTELNADLAEEATTSSHASELLDQETAERMRLEKELKEIQVCREMFFFYH